MKVFRFTFYALTLIAAALCVTWAFGALYSDFPKAGTLAATVFVMAVLATAILLARNR